jgi:2-polyprenyl-3-methyl-5-hydroxy-6-metoxy-1,4-benzoquinol methylase
MKLGVVADNLVESLAMASGAVPEPVVLGAWGLFVSRMLLAGAKLGVFDALSEGPNTAAAMAPTLAVSSEGLERLLRALNGLGYLKRAEDTYALAPVAKKWLARTSKNDMRAAVLFIEELWRWTSGLEEAVRTGVPSRIHEDPEMTPAAWGRYMRGLAVFAKPAGAEVVRRVKLPGGAKRILDVGGGHGMYSVAFCQRHSGLTAEVLDLPEAAAQGRAIVAEAGFQDRVTFREGDMRTAEWGEGYDAVLLFNVLHNATLAEATAVVQKAFAALAPRGVLVIQESEYRQTKGDLSFAAGFGELFFFIVSGARTWPEATLRGWAESAGFAPVKTKRLWLAPSVLVTGVKPG